MRKKKENKMNERMIRLIFSVDFRHFSSKMKLVHHRIIHSDEFCIFCHDFDLYV